MTPDTPIRPSVGRIAAIVLLGPIVGSIAVFILPFLLDPPADDGAMAFRFLPLLLFFGYIFGIVPSAVAAFLYSVFYRRLGKGWVRWLQCALIGALCGGLLVQPFVWLFAGRPVFEMGMLVLGASAGGVALPVTALLFPKPTP